MIFTNQAGMGGRRVTPDFVRSMLDGVWSSLKREFGVYMAVAKDQDLKTDTAMCELFVTAKEILERDRLSSFELMQGQTGTIGDGGRALVENPEHRGIAMWGKHGPRANTRERPHATANKQSQ